MEATGRVTICRYKVRGLADPICLLLEYLHVSYNVSEVEYSASSTEGEFKSLPLFRDNDTGFELTNTIAICTYIGLRYRPKMVGSAMNEFAETDSLLYLSFDIRKIILEAIEQGWEKAGPETINEVKEKLNFIEKFLKGRNWLVGKHPSIADFYVMEVVELFEWAGQKEDLLEKYCRIRNLIKKLHAIPEIAKYKGADQKEFENNSNALLMLLSEK